VDNAHAIVANRDIFGAMSQPRPTAVAHSTTASSGNRARSARATGRTALPALQPWAAIVVPLPDGRVQVGLDPRRRRRFSGPDAVAVERTVSVLRNHQRLHPVPQWLETGVQLLAAADALTRPPVPASPAAHRVVSLQGPAAMLDRIRPALELAGWRADASSRFPAAGGVILRVGRPRWPWIQAAMSRGLPHLVISPRQDSVRVGPAVVPGATPCLRCLHLARSDRDRDWPWVCQRLESRPLPQPPDRLLHESGLVAAHLLDATVGNGPQQTESGGYWELHRDRIGRERTAVARHPLCGCWWPEAA
jgi:hypothetical protein